MHENCASFIKKIKRMILFSCLQLNLCVLYDFLIKKRGCPESN